MKHCCEDKAESLNQLRVKQSKALKIVFAINLMMFFVEFGSGWYSSSTALMGDSLDMLGDAFVYGFSLYVIYKSVAMRARAAQLKGIIMLAFGVGVLGQAIYKVVSAQIPVYETMGIVGAFALMANLICLWVLYTHRDDDINMKSTWICSRNDIISNVGILMAAVLVARLNSFWPDVIVGTIISVLFLSSAHSVLKEAKQSV
jgi:cation diffusion facilitator family transporter